MFWGILYDLLPSGSNYCSKNNWSCWSSKLWLQGVLWIIFRQQTFTITNSIRTLTILSISAKPFNLYTDLWFIANASIIFCPDWTIQVHSCVKENRVLVVNKSDVLSTSEIASNWGYNISLGNLSWGYFFYLFFLSPLSFLTKIRYNMTTN